MPCQHVHQIRARHATTLGNGRCHGDDPDCPHPLTIGDTEFHAQAMVDWLAPGQLASTGLKTVTASTFGAYADKREMQAALATRPRASGYDVEGDYTADANAQPVNEIWFDYVADLGDGFDATYTIARLMASDVRVDGTVLPQGRFVVLGGDQVYPTASREEYQNRFLGPYRAANPWSSDPRHLYALPGNHDWYDGLTSFLRIFCQSRDVPGRNARWVGAWRTQQRRSYFAIRLPHDWWIWGIDSQLESDLDRPQVDYFTAVAEEMVRQADGNPSRHKIILVTAEPNWVYCGDTTAAKSQCPVSPEDFNTLMWFENRLIRTKGFRLPLVVAGDLHHYVRYLSEDNLTHRITSGGGGAYLLGTHQMPQRVDLPEGTTETTVDQMKKRPYQRTVAYPDSKTSQEIAKRVRELPKRNRKFSTLLGAAYLLFGLSLVAGSMLSIALGLMIVFAFHGYTSTSATRQPLVKGREGMVHGLVHVALATLVITLTYWLPLLLLGGSSLLLRIGIIAVSSLLAFLTGYWIGASVFASYLLFMSRRTGAHTGEVFSSMSISGYKNFLRMHIDRDGALRVYAVGVDEVISDWTFNPTASDECGAPWFVSKSNAAVRPSLIDRIAPIA